MSDESKTMVYAALAGNVLVAASKFIAAAISGSTAMFTEAIHSSTDCINQLLLLLGSWRSKKKPDRSHPFGYDGEIYFYAFVIAVIVLLAGGVFSLDQGIRHLLNPHTIEAPGTTFIVLALSTLFEGGSLFFGYRASRRFVARHAGKGRQVSTWRFIGLSKDPNMYETLLEDAAALVGIVLAAIGVAGSVFFQQLWMDATASIAIGLLLIGNSIGIAIATRSLIAGEAVAPALMGKIEAVLQRAGYSRSCGDLKSLHLGPNTILITLAIDPSEQPQDLPFHVFVDAVEREIKSVDERIAYVFFELRRKLSVDQLHQ